MKYFSVKDTARVFVYSAPVHMGKSFRALSALVKNDLKKDVGIGDLFLFLNKKKTYVKILFFAHGGPCIFAKVMPSGFALDVTTARTLRMDDLQKIVNGTEKKKLAIAA